MATKVKQGVLFLWAKWSPSISPDGFGRIQRGLCGKVLECWFGSLMLHPTGFEDLRVVGIGRTRRCTWQRALESFPFPPQSAHTAGSARKAVPLSIRFRR